MRDWQALRADAEIQFAPLPPPPPQQIPGWWRALIEWLGEVIGPVARALGAVGQALGISVPVLMWVLGGIAALLVTVLVARSIAVARRRRRPAGQAPEWAPNTGQALALLEDADRLAGEGRYDEATHLLLQRSVGQIAAARPGLIEPATTAREIAMLPALSQAARNAFATIAERVERSLFALRRLDADDWRAARAAYADFALAVPAA
jgi:hypothetical protein